MTSVTGEHGPHEMLAGISRQDLASSVKGDGALRIDAKALK